MQEEARVLLNEQTQAKELMHPGNVNVWSAQRKSELKGELRPTVGAEPAPQQMANALMLLDTGQVSHASQGSFLRSILL